MAKDWDIAKILSKIVEGEDQATVDRIASKITKNYPEKAPLILRALKEIETFDEDHVSLTSARALTQEEKDDAIKSLNESYGDIFIEFKVDPEIIGGVVIQKGDTVIDNSIKSKIGQIVENINVKY
ncbi:F0F1 ATP synthase subunit delta [bacterium]|nr:F0F1 ATP synthase subunit delta [bacterium]